VIAASGRGESVIRPALLLTGVGIAALVVQGALAALLPPALVPDLGLLVTVIAAVEAPAILALALAALLGYGTDYLSGTLLGEAALLRVLTFATTRFVSAQFHLERPLPLAGLCVAVAFVEPLGTAALSSLFAGASPFGWEALPTIACRAAIAGALAPVVQPIVSGALLGLGDGDPRRREVRFETRRPVL
jgi:rod shape-determining protein MreD